MGRIVTGLFLLGELLGAGLAAHADSLLIGDLKLDTYPGAELVMQSPATAESTHQVVLGALKKVNNELMPERDETVRGVKVAYTWYLPEARRTSDAGRFFETQLTRLGQVLFQCEGRTCGSSSYWAHKVFDRAILYGPEQHQRYYIAKTTRPNGFLAVYVGQRATRKIYVHVEFVSVAGGGQLPDSKEIVAALESTGRFVFDSAALGQYPDALVQTMIRVVTTYSRQGDVLMLLVAHDKLRDGESLDTAIKRTTSKAIALATLIKKGAGEPLQLDGRGVGPLAPDDVYGAERLELIVLHPRNP